MKLNSIQVAGLKALVADLAERPVGELAPEAKAAFTVGRVYGRADLARELLQESLDSVPSVTLASAALALYTAGRWTLATMAKEDQIKLWEALRDALQLPPGTSTRIEEACVATACDLTGAARR